MNSSSSPTSAKNRIPRNTFPILKKSPTTIHCKERMIYMTIIYKLKKEIQILSPDDYRNAMLLRFGLTDGVTHSREEVCSLYNIDAKKVSKLEHRIINNVFKELI